MSEKKLPDPSTQNLMVYASWDDEEEKGDVWSKDYGLLRLPAGWAFLGAGDPFITRTVKKLGPSWLLLKNDRRRRITRRLGIYAPTENIQKAFPGTRKRLGLSQGTAPHPFRAELAN